MKINKRIVRFFKDFGFQRVRHELGQYALNDVFLDIEEDGLILIYIAISKYHDKTILEIESCNSLKKLKSELMKKCFLEVLNSATKQK